MPRPFDDHEPHCRRELRRRRFAHDDPRVADECRCNAPWLILPPRRPMVLSGTHDGAS